VTNFARVIQNIERANEIAFYGTQFEFTLKYCLYVDIAQRGLFLEAHFVFIQIALCVKSLTELQKMFSFFS
jgi:hypothetical protein